MGFLDKICQKNPTIVTRKIGDVVILVPTKKQIEGIANLFVINSTAASIWSQIDGVTSLETIKENLLKEFEATPEEIESDLVDFIFQLEEAETIFFTDLKKEVA